MVSGGKWIGEKHASQGIISEPFTDGFTSFAGAVDATGVISYESGNPITLKFSGLDSSQKYEAVLFGNRGRESLCGETESNYHHRFRWVH